MSINLFQPGMILVVCGLLALILPESLRKILVLVAPIGTLAAVVTYDGDQLAFMFGLIFSLISLIAAIYNLHVKDRYEIASEMVYAGSSISVVFAATWINLIVFWEVMAVASWLIILCARNERATKAGFRYLLVHMLGGNLLLAGIIIKLVQGSTAVTLLTTATPDAAYWLILAGVAVNAAIPPLHSWIADAYPEAPMGGTVYMGSFTTKVGVYCLIRLFAGTELLLYFGVAMAVLGACMALMENDLRKLLAYHIVSQVGYMVASLALGGAMGIDGAAAHAFNHILYKGTLFMCAGVIIESTGFRKISDLGGLAKKMPVTALCFLAASMAIAGFPLFNGFVSKSLIMGAAAESGIHWAELLLMLASVGTLMSVTLKINWFVFFGKTDKDIQVSESEVPMNRKIAMVMGATSCFACGIMPGFTYDITPYGIDGHPFTVDHVTQYMQLFSAAAIAFFMYLEHMKPHVAITLDTDWFYRKPLKAAISWISVNCEGIRQGSGKVLGTLVQKGNTYLHKPELLLEKWFGLKPAVSPDCLEDDDVLQKPAGVLVGLNFVIFLAVVLFVFYNLK